MVAIIGKCRPLPEVRLKRAASELHAVGAANPTAKNEIGHVIQQMILEYWKCIVYPKVTELISIVNERGLRIEFSGGQRVQMGQYELILKAVLRIKPDEFSQSLPVDGRMSPVYNLPQHVFEANGATKLHAILNLTNRLLRFLNNTSEFRHHNAPTPASHDQPIAPAVLSDPVLLDRATTNQTDFSSMLENSDLSIEEIFGECKPEPERNLKSISQMLQRLSVAHPTISEQTTGIIKQLEEEYEKHVCWQRLEQLMVLQWERGIQMEFSSGVTTVEGVDEIHIQIDLRVATANSPWAHCQGPRPLSQTFCVSAPTCIRAIAYAIDAAQRFLDCNPEFRWVEGGLPAIKPLAVRPPPARLAESRYAFARNT